MQRQYRGFDGSAGVVYNPATMKIDRTRLFDKRVVQRNIRAGRVTKEEYRAWLAEVGDASEKIMPREDGGDDDGYEGAKPDAVAADGAAPEGDAPAVAADGAAPEVAAAPAAAPAEVAPASSPEPPPAG